MKESLDDGRVKVIGHSNLWFSYTMSSDAGEYTCVVRHRGGEITRKYNLDVLGKYAVWGHELKYLISIVG